jgi:hypothetical protein
MRTSCGVLGGLSLAGIAACISFGCAASGVEDDNSTGYLASTPIDASADQGESVMLPPSNPKKEQPADPQDAGGGLTDAGTGGDAGNGNGNGNGNGSGGTCTASNTCMAAADLGTVSGDTGADQQSAQGTGSKWFTVRVTENDSSIFAVPLWMKATLTSPPSANYDLYVYVPATDTRECSAVTGSSTSSATTDTAGVEFGESGSVSNGKSDDRTVTIEVRHVSGPCTPSDQWTLTVDGNQK